jgi:hypothetical protein
MVPVFRSICRHSLIFAHKNPDRVRSGFNKERAQIVRQIRFKCP